MNKTNEIPTWVGNSNKPYGLSEFERWHIEQFGKEPEFSFMDFENDDRVVRECYITINGVEYSSVGSSDYECKMYAIRDVSVGLGYSDGSSHPYIVQEPSAIDNYNSKMMSFLNAEVARFARY